MITIDIVGILSGNWQWFTLSTVVSPIALLLAIGSIWVHEYRLDPYYHWAWSHGKWSETKKRWEPARVPPNYFGNVLFFPTLILSITSPVLAAAGIFTALWITVFH